MKTITRLIATGAAAIALATSSLAVAQDKVSLRLNWYLGGLHVPFYYGKDKGYYAAEGIDLTINEGRGSANTVQVVAAGSDTFGLADSSSSSLTAVEGRRRQMRDVAAELRPASPSSRSPTPASRRRRISRARKWPSPPGDPLGQLLQAVCKANKRRLQQDHDGPGRPGRESRDGAREEGRRAARRRRRPVLPDQVQGRSSRPRCATPISARTSSA